MYEVNSNHTFPPLENGFLPPEQVWASQNWRKNSSAIKPTKDQHKWKQLLITSNPNTKEKSHHEDELLKDSH